MSYLIQRLKKTKIADGRHLFYIWSEAYIAVFEIRRPQSIVALFSKVFKKL